MILLMDSLASLQDQALRMFYPKAASWRKKKASARIVGFEKPRERIGWHDDGRYLREEGDGPNLRAPHFSLLPTVEYKAEYKGSVLLQL